MKTLILILCLIPFFGFSQTQLVEFNVKLPTSKLEEHIVKITFPNAQNLAVIEFDRIPDGIVQIWINNRLEVKSDGFSQRFELDAKVHPKNQ